MGKRQERGDGWGLLTAGSQMGQESVGLAREPGAQRRVRRLQPCADLREVEGKAGTLNGHWASLELSLENKV